MPVAASPSTAAASAAAQAHRSALALVATLFFMWGFLTVLNGILDPHCKAIFDLNDTRVMLIRFTFSPASFLPPAPVGKIVGWTGYQSSMVLGPGVMAAGALVFLPAAGMTVLHVFHNPYVTVPGPPEGASSRLNPSHGARRPDRLPPFRIRLGQDAVPRLRRHPLRARYRPLLRRRGLHRRFSGQFLPAAGYRRAGRTDRRALRLLLLVGRHGGALRGRMAHAPHPRRPHRHPPGTCHPGALPSLRRLLCAPRMPV